MKILTIISLAVILCFGARTAQKSLNECLYELHKLSNELNGILYFGYTEQFEFATANEVLQNIEIYPEEVYEFERFIIRLKSEYDKSGGPTCFLDKAKAKEIEFNLKAVECEKLLK